MSPEVNEWQVMGRFASLEEPWLLGNNRFLTALSARFGMTKWSDCSD
jgi:hypothetical protein